MHRKKEGGSVKWNVGLARESVLSLAPTEGPGPRKTLFTGVPVPSPAVRYHSRIYGEFPPNQSFKLVSNNERGGRDGAHCLNNIAIRPD